MSKRSLVLGCNGQDGSYLCELLLEKGYEVWGLYRRSSSPNFSRIAHIKDKIHLVEGDVTDFSLIYNLVIEGWFDEIYNLAAQSHVHTSFSNPIYTTEVDYGGCLNILEALAFCSKVPEKVRKRTKFYQASTSEMYGSSYTKSGHGYNYSTYQDEQTPMLPNSPYAIAKLAAHHA